jgi:hypothetical protein
MATVSAPLTRMHSGRRGIARATAFCRSLASMALAVRRSAGLLTRVAQALQEAQLFKLLVPARYGGLETNLRTMMEVSAEVPVATARPRAARLHRPAARRRAPGQLDRGQPRRAAADAVPPRTLRGQGDADLARGPRRCDRHTSRAGLGIRGTGMFVWPIPAPAPNHHTDADRLARERQPQPGLLRQRVRVKARRQPPGDDPRVRTPPTGREISGDARARARISGPACHPSHPQHPHSAPRVILPNPRRVPRELPVPESK